MSFAPMQRLKGLYLAGMRFMYFSPLFSNSNTKRKVYLSPGERLFAKIAPALKDFGGERLTSGSFSTYGPKILKNNEIEIRIL